MFVVLLIVEATDVLFAVDSVPAVLAVSHEQFIVFSSNAFAILGLQRFGFRPLEGVIAVMVRIEDVLHRLAGEPFDIGQRGAGAAWKVGVHHDQVVLHLDDDVVAVAQVHQVALAEPYPRHDLFHRPRLRIRANHKK